MLASTTARALEVASNRGAGLVGEVFRRHSLSHAAGNALAVIEGAGRPLTPGEIGTAMHVTSGSTTSLIDNLEKRGLVTRTPDPGDRRRFLIDITPEAQAVLDEVLLEVQLASRTFMAPLSESDQRELLRLLRVLAERELTLADVPAPTSPRKRPAHLTRPLP